MYNDFQQHKVLSRRLFFILWIKVILIFVLIIRLYYLQAIKFKKYKVLSDSNRIRTIILPPLRGNIYDKNLKKVAGNKNYYRVIISNYGMKKKEREEIIDRISKILQIEKSLIYTNVKRSTKYGVSSYVIAYDHLKWEEVAKIEVNLPKLRGVSIDVGQVRYYAYGNSMSHLVGYIAGASEDDIKKHNNPYLSHPDFKLGKYGIEKSLDNQLRGFAGIKNQEVNAFGEVIRNIDNSGNKDSIAGKDVVLTIDADLQQYGQMLLKDKQGAIVVLDIKNGGILSLISSPSYPADEFLTGISHARWKELQEDPTKPLINRAISSTYPPGSTFKLVVAIAALINGISENKIINCPGHYNLGRKTFHCWKEEGHGNVNITEAIMGSCNVYFYNIAREIGIENIYNVATKLGLGEKFDLELSGQKIGNVPNIAWKKKRFNDGWFVGDTLNSAIGQGYVEASPLQLAVMVARIASKGRKVEPHLVKHINTSTVGIEHNHLMKQKLLEQKDLYFPSINIDEEIFNKVINAANMVVNDPRGTAYRSHIEPPEFAMGGKTGTSQVVGIDRSRKGKPVVSRMHHGLFVGYAPVSDPKYAISVVVEHGGSGSGSAAPVAKEMLSYIQNKENKASSQDTQKENEKAHIS